jgi:hypothetical protein
VTEHLASLEYAGAPRDAWNAFCDALALDDLRNRPRARR